MPTFKTSVKFLLDIFSNLFKMGPINQWNSSMTQDWINSFWSPSQFSDGIGMRGILFCVLKYWLETTSWLLADSFNERKTNVGGYLDVPLSKINKRPCVLWRYFAADPWSIGITFNWHVSFVEAWPDLFIFLFRGFPIKYVPAHTFVAHKTYYYYIIVHKHAWF